MKRKNRVISLLSGFLALLMVLSLGAELSSVPVTVEAATSSQIKGQLDDLKKQKAELQSKLASIKKDYDANANELDRLLGEKNVIDQEIGLLGQQVDNINEQILTYGLLIADKQDELDVAQKRLEELTAANRERIRAMEENGKLSYWAVVFEATSFTDLLDRMNMIKEINEADKRRMAEMSAVALEVSQAQETLNQEKTALEASRAELDQLQKELEGKRAELDRVLEELQKNKDELQRLLDENEDAEDAILAEIAKKEQEYNDALAKENPVIPSTGTKPPTTTNGIVWHMPIAWYTRVTSPFSEARMHPTLGYVRPHHGIDLGAPQGVEIYATRAGTVTAKRYQYPGAGYYVTINHGDGFSSIYMHMSQYAAGLYEGQQVQAGQLIGYVGMTGGISTGNHLHFGISYAGKYYDPANYINFN